MSRTVQVKRDAITQTRIADTPLPPLGEGQVRLKLESFSVTANKVTYAVVGVVLIVGVIVWMKPDAPVTADVAVSNPGPSAYQSVRERMGERSDVEGRTSESTPLRVGIGNERV